MTDNKTKWTVDGSTYASNPGRIEVDWVRWLAFYPLWPAVWAGSFVLAFILALFTHWIFWLLTVPLLAMNGFYWVRVREHFKHGCANPGVLVSADPVLIAVSTDLGRGPEEYPAIKIIRKRLQGMAGRPATIGARLPTVALYYAGETDAHWEDFDPRPAECATDDPKEIERLMSTFTAKDWRALDDGLKRLPTPYRPGLYHLRPQRLDVLAWNGP